MVYEEVKRKCGALLNQLLAVHCFLGNFSMRKIGFAAMSWIIKLVSWTAAPNTGCSIPSSRVIMRKRFECAADCSFSSFTIAAPPSSIILSL